jgi:hypothetical protein
MLTVDMLRTCNEALRYFQLIVPRDRRMQILAGRIREQTFAAPRLGLTFSFYPACRPSVASWADAEGHSAGDSTKSPMSAKGPASDPLCDLVHTDGSRQSPMSPGFPILQDRFSIGVARMPGGMARSARSCVLPGLRSVRAGGGSGCGFGPRLGFGWGGRRGIEPGA